ncbi:MAG: hypothetical protein KA735_12350 [Burkholderiaceae bacterium]|nr:hypothetical protein [Burkholderiaceae bacterium]
MKTLKPLLGGCILGLCTLAFAAQAQTTAPATPNAPAATSSSPSTSGMPMTQEQMKANHEAEMKKCDAMSGAAKDTCMAQAKTDHEKNKADAMKDKNPATAPTENQKKY